MLHFIEQDFLARATAAEIKAKVFLFNAVVDGNLRASVKQLGAEFLNMILRRGKVVRTPIGNVTAARALDRVNRQFKADRPNQL